MCDMCNFLPRQIPRAARASLGTLCPALLVVFGSIPRQGGLVRTSSVSIQLNTPRRRLQVYELVFLLGSFRLHRYICRDRRAPFRPAPAVVFLVQRQAIEFGFTKAFVDDVMHVAQP